MRETAEVAQENSVRGILLPKVPHRPLLRNSATCLGNAFRQIKSAALAQSQYGACLHFVSRRFTGVRRFRREQTRRRQYARIRRRMTGSC